MRATGIVRRVDDLGRVVIPKEIRKNLRIREGEPLEIYLDNINGMPMVGFVKYNHNSTEELKRISESIVNQMVDCSEFETAINFHKAIEKAIEIYRQFEED